MTPKLRRIIGGVAAFVVIGVVMVLIAIFFVSLGSKAGPVITGSVAAAAGFVGVLVAVGFGVYEYIRKGESERRERPERDPAEPTWPTKWAILVSVIVVVIVVVAVYWIIIHRPDKPITDRVALSPTGAGLRTGNAVRMAVPGNPPQRDNIALTLTVVNRDPAASNCVSPARLYIDSFVDGVRAKGPQVIARSAEQVKLPLTGATRTAQLRITLRERDPACVVDLHVTEATLFNNAVF